MLFGARQPCRPQHKFAEAEPVLRDVLAIQQRVLGKGTPTQLARAPNSRCCSATSASMPNPRRWAGVHWPRPTARWHSKKGL